jgi:hypothetical protein
MYLQTCLSLMPRAARLYTPSIFYTISTFHTLNYILMYTRSHTSQPYRCILLTAPTKITKSR